MLDLEQNGQNYAYLYDGKGNVIAVLDNSEAVVATYRYDPFGILLAQSGSLTQPFGFSTKRYDAQTGLVYYGHRYYSPAIGRWTTRDPLGEVGGLNLYAFVGNNPVNWVDPWGLLMGPYRPGACNPTLMLQDPTCVFSLEGGGGGGGGGGGYIDPGKVLAALYGIYVAGKHFVKPNKIDPYIAKQNKKALTEKNKSPEPTPGDWEHWCDRAWYWVKKGPIHKLSIKQQNDWYKRFKICEEMGWYSSVNPDTDDDTDSDMDGIPDHLDM